MSKIYSETANIEQQLQHLEQMMRDAGLEIYVGCGGSLRVKCGTADGVLGTCYGYTTNLPRSVDDERIFAEE